MKQLLKYFFIILLFIFSIYYTDKSVDILKLNDPIMKEIKNNLNKYKIESINATINNNIIIPGKEGQEVDVKKTYDAMRKYGSYNENLIKIKEIIPTISINDNLDKYIKLNNSDNKKISLIFIINKEVNINNLNKTLEKNNITATFFIEKNLIENNINFIKNTNHQIELLNSNKILFNSTKSYLESLTNSKLKYCYTEEENNNILELCKDNKMYTIMPSLIIKKDLYKNIKSNIESSPIISIYLNKYTEKELNPSIEYLKKKGYKFYNLKSLINEEV